MVNREWRSGVPVLRAPIHDSRFAIHDWRLVPIVPVLGAGWIELPAVRVALGDLLLALELLVVLVLDAHSLPDVVNDVLIWCGIVAAGRFVADAVSGFPVGVHVAGRHGRAGLGVFRKLLLHAA